MWVNIKAEPALLTAIVAALIALAVGFGLALTGEQVTLVMTCVLAIQALFVRRLVSPVSKL